MERKFTQLTETFIADQINALVNIKHAVFTVKYLNNLHVNAEVYYPAYVQRFWDFKYISKRNKDYFDDKFAQTDCRIFHSHYLTDASYFHPFTKNYKHPKICSCYGYDVSSFPKKYGVFSRPYFDRVFKEYDLFLAMSEDMRQDLIKLGCPVEKIKLHYYGVNTSKFNMPRDYSLKNNCLNILTTGSLDPRKGHMTILKAIKKIKENSPELLLRYTIVGDGILRAQLVKYVIDNSLDGIVAFKGFIRHGDEFNQILREADIFIHPSTTPGNGDKEGIPGAIVEAMASGLPVISTYHAGIPSVIQNGVTGFLFKENDSEGIADQIVSLYIDSLRDSIGVNAREYAKTHLDLFNKANEMRKIYECLIK